MTLKQARERKALTQAQLARLAGVEQQTISRIETGQTREPSHRVVLCVSKALGVEPSSIAEFAVDLSCVIGAAR